MITLSLCYGNVLQKPFKICFWFLSWYVDMSMMDLPPIDALVFMQAVMVNALMNHFTSRRRSSAQSGSSDEVDGIHGDQDLDGNQTSSFF